MQSLMLHLIKWYQKYLAWFNGPSVCRFPVRCSQYTYESVSRYGVIKGTWMGLVRLSHCHPWY